MAVDWNVPSLSQLWADFLTAIRARDESAAKMDYTGDTNLPTGVIRWNTGNNRFERWGGASWTAMTPDLTSMTGILPAAHFNDTTHGARAGGTTHSAATTSVAGFLSATDKAKLDNAVSAATASRLMIRDASGRAQVATPSAAADIVRKDYADALGVSAPTVSTIMRRDASGRAQVATPSAAADIVRKDYADALGVSAPTVSTIMRRDASGRAQVATPSADADIATKLYVDGLVSATFTTGDAKLTYKTAADTGWVMMNDGTIGSASSGATTRANADTEDLFTLFWNNIPNTWCAVSGGRGASAAADFAANKTLALPKELGRALCIAGAGAGLTSRVLGEYLGSQDAVVVQHNHSINDPEHGHTINPNSPTIGTELNAVTPGSEGMGETGGYIATNATGISINNAGVSGTGANMQPSSFLNIMVKL